MQCDRGQQTAVLEQILMPVTVNSRVFPRIAPLLELGPNSAIYQISPKLFQNGMTRPEYMRLSVICLTLSHRMNQTRDSIYSNTLAPAFFHYRGLVIRSLHEEIDVDYKRTSNLVVAGILTLIIIDVSRIVLPPVRKS